MIPRSKTMKSATLVLSGFAISPLAVSAASDFYPLPPGVSELPYNDDHGDDPASSVKICPLSCLNNGTCTSQGTTAGIVGGIISQPNEEWSCDCPSGFHGDLCEQEDNLCGEESCQHGSKCIQINESEHICDCTSAYTDTTYYAGKYCQFPSTVFCTEPNHPEGRQFCVNDGSCGALDHAPCNCPNGFAGPRCATRVDDDTTSYDACSLECRNDGTCHKGEKGMESYGKFAVDVSHLIQETHINFEHCICPRGYFGVKCEYEYEECGENEHMCLNGGSCEIAQDGSHRCACLDGYFGEGCEFELLTEQQKKSQYHPVLRILWYGIWAVLVVTGGIVLYHRTLEEGDDDENQQVARAIRKHHSPIV